MTADAPIIETESLQAQLTREARTCPGCSLQVQSPFIERCPRCNIRLPEVPHDCPGCIHRITCPVAKQTIL